MRSFSTDIDSSGYALYLLVWPADGIMRKDDVRRAYDGSIFYQKAAEYAEKKKQRAA